VAEPVPDYVTGPLGAASWSAAVLGFFSLVFALMATVSFAGACGKVLNLFDITSESRQFLLCFLPFAGTRCVMLYILTVRLFLYRQEGKSLLQYNDMTGVEETLTRQAQLWRTFAITAAVTLAAAPFSWYTTLSAAQEEAKQYREAQEEIKQYRERHG
jgi:hypothetical protein